MPKDLGNGLGRKESIEGDSMKVGDLVKTCYLREVEPDEHPLLGIILAEVSGKTSTADNDVFRVLWTCGRISERMWEYDLMKVIA